MLNGNYNSHDHAIVILMNDGFSLEEAILALNISNIDKSSQNANYTENDDLDDCDSLKICNQLMQMGFDDNIALDSVKWNGTNIEKCINYILKQNKDQGQEALEDGDEIKTNEFEKQTYKERIDSVLEVVQQQETCDQLQTQDIYCLVDEVYSNKNRISGFIADCGEYAMNFDHISADNVNKCAMEQCECIKREFRNRNIYDKNVNARCKLYKHCESDKSVVIQQYVD
eukprot:6675_1